MRVQGRLAPVEVEVSLIPGLPQISFLGLPDAAIRESVLRVKSALRHQGFQTPRAHQTLVHLRPSHLRKTSRGLDLAVAAAILWETDQIPKPRDGSTPLVYGELSLKGEIFRPDDLEEASGEWAQDSVLTGPGPAHATLETRVAANLRGLSSAVSVAARDDGPGPVRPRPARTVWASEAARLLAVVASGEHSCAIVGPHGTGKTSFAESVAAFLEPPAASAFRASRIEAIARGDSVPEWRPVVQPHHSISALAMIGGGVPPRPGEITRAHGGLLILDELLEFDSSVQEALREPLESGSIRLARAGAVRAFPARFALVATTNLCPCGRYDPVAGGSACKCPRSKRDRSLARLSGPFLDRLDLLVSSGDWLSMRDPVGVDQIDQWTRQARETRLRRGQIEPNARTAATALLDGLGPFEREQILRGPFGSARRNLAIVRVARTLADLDGQDIIGSEHWACAMRWSACSFEKLEAAR